MRKSHFLPVYESNALADVERLLPAWLAKPGERRPALSLCTHLRQAAIASLLQTGESRTFRLRLQKSARLYVAFVQASSQENQRRSQALPFFDALTAGDLDTAREIARLSSARWVSDVEAEEDFLFVHACMRMLEGATDEELGNLAGRWHVALEGSHDPRLGVLRAMIQREEDEQLSALQDFLDTRRGELDDETRSTPEALATEVVVSVEGLGLLRLARLRGIDIRGPLRGAPSAARDDTALPFTPDSYRTPD